MTDIIKLLEEKEKQQRKSMQDFLLDTFDLISFLVFVWGIVLFVRFFIFNPYTVVWQSMEPTFDQKDFIIVDKVSPKVSEFKRGDVVVFVPPKKDIPYIKRIIWLPWETIKIKTWHVYVCKDTENTNNCEKLQEDYLPTTTITSPTCNISTFEVTKWSYFVLWDNRWHSTDSRCCFWLWCHNWASYLVPENYIVWKVYMRLFPHFDKF